jgi:MFS family permease
VAILGGPALGGYLIAQSSVGLAFAFDALTFVISFLALLLTRRKTFQIPDVDRPKARSGSVRRQWREIFGGVRFLKGEISILSLIIFFSLVNGLNNVEAVLVPRLVRTELGLPATAFGLLASAMGAGTLLGAIVTGLVAGRVHRRAQVICLAMLVFGVAIIAMGLANTALMLDIAYFVLGLSFIVPEVMFTSLLQLVIPAAMRGRVFSVLTLIAMAMNPLGLALAGVLGDAFGTRAGLWMGGGAIGVLSVLALALPNVRALNTRDVMANEATTTVSPELSAQTGA